MKQIRKRPPSLGEWMLKRILLKEEYLEKLGDFEEGYVNKIEESGFFKANAWYWFQILIAVPAFIKNTSYWRLSMLLNYIKIALRNLRKQKLYSFITLSGLSMGLAIFILFALLNRFAKTFDSCHLNRDRIYGVVQVMPGGREGEAHSAIVSAPLLAALINEFPEIEDGVRFLPAGQMIVKRNDKIFYESRIHFVDKNFLSFFSFPIMIGNKETMLSDPNSIVLTKEMALKYFGEENPIGQSLTLNNQVDVVVSGITDNNPMNSSVRYDFLLSMETAKILNKNLSDWKTFNQAAFILLPEGYKPNQLEQKFDAFLSKHYAVSETSPRRMYLHAMGDFYLNSNDMDCLWRHGRANFTVLWIISVLILLIASINFVNLSTARYVTRAKEVGLRKVIGAYRFQLIRQFLSETILLAFLALPIAIFIYAVMQPLFKTFLGNIFSGTLTDYPEVMILIVCVTFLTGLFSGIYPAFYLSVFQPVKILKGDTQKGNKGNLFRKVLVVIQFSFSIILILMTLINIRQSKHNIEVDLGFDRQRIIAVNLNENTRTSLNVLKKELVRHRDIQWVSASRALPISWETEKQVLSEGAGLDESLTMNVYGVDYDFVEMLKIHMKQGRSFSREYNESGHFIISNKAAGQLKLDNPVGRPLTVGDQRGTIIGVSEDFHFKSILFTQLSPAVLFFEPVQLNYLLVKYLSSSSKEGVVRFLENQWKTMNPDQPFEFNTLDASFRDNYITNDKTTELTSVLGLMAIFLSCMGLLGLSSFSVERRIKEIGIRKVLGASVSGVVLMLVKSFLKLVIIANVIAIPIAYLLMVRINRFFYVYPVKIKMDLFLFTLLGTLVVAFLTVLSQTYNAAQDNPVHSLKYE
jgi:putative ABC transport system permease protein